MYAGHRLQTFKYKQYALTFDYCRLEPRLLFMSANGINQQTNKPTKDESFSWLARLITSPLYNALCYLNHQLLLGRFPKNVDGS